MIIFRNESDLDHFLKIDHRKGQVYWPLLSNESDSSSLRILRIRSLFLRTYLNQLQNPNIIPTSPIIKMMEAKAKMLKVDTDRIVNIR